MAEAEEHLDLENKVVELQVTLQRYSLLVKNLLDTGPVVLYLQNCSVHQMERGLGKCSQKAIIIHSANLLWTTSLKSVIQELNGRSSEPIAYLQYWLAHDSDNCTNKRTHTCIVKVPPDFGTGLSSNVMPLPQ